MELTAIQDVLVFFGEREKEAQAAVNALIAREAPPGAAPVAGTTAGKAVGPASRHSTFEAHQGRPFSQEGPFQVRTGAPPVIGHTKCMLAQLSMGPAVRLHRA